MLFFSIVILEIKAYDRKLSSNLHLTYLLNLCRGWYLFCECLNTVREKIVISLLYQIPSFVQRSKSNFKFQFYDVEKLRQLLADLENGTNSSAVFRHKSVQMYFHC